MFVQIPGVARTAWLLPADVFPTLKGREWPAVLDVAHEHYERDWAVSDSASAEARAAVRAWLAEDANRDEMQAVFEEDRARRDPASRKLLMDKERLASENEGLRARIAGQLGDAKPASDELLVSFGKAIADRRDHEHPKHEDFFCLNLSSYMGERAAPVLRRLLDAEAERDDLRARAPELETARRTDRAAVLIALALAMREEPPYDLNGKIEDLGELALIGEPDEIAALIGEITQLTAMDEVASKVAKSGLLFAAADMAKQAVTRELVTGESASLGEWSAKDAERGWEQHGDGWLCPQCAADATDRAEFLADRTAKVPDFFQAGHTYSGQYGWKFRCDTVTNHPEDGERAALGWRFFDGRWKPYEYGEDDWEIGQPVGQPTRGEDG
ncbi:hypothetical protein ACFV0C_36825 [Streptomyces sp. NPDC059568]|uniref:hypothetical protein n=1 Tax=Streptomyces sp. NPDC059568 TaxID=3346868 RepID=UPI0036A5E5C3